MNVLIAVKSSPLCETSPCNRVCLIGTNSENGRLGRLGICVCFTSNSNNGRCGRFGRPAEPSAPKGRRLGRLKRDSHFHLQNSDNEANLLALLRW